VSPYLTLVFLMGLVAVQTAALPYAAPGTFKPLLPVLAVVAWGLLRNRREAAWWGLLLGYMLDVVSPTPFGTYTLPMLVAVMVVGIGGSNLFPTNFILPGAVAAAATVAFTVTQLSLVAAMNRGTVSWSAASMGDDILPVVALNLLWLPALYFPLRFVARRIGPPRIEWER
jgi:rod shape-determining protein MreD